MEIGGRSMGGLLSRARQVAIINELLSPVIALVVTFLIVGFMMFSIGVSPVKGFLALFSGALGSRYSVGLTLVCAAPLLLAGLSVCFAYRSGLINIGGEGQLHMGALFAFLVGFGTGSAFLAVVAGFVGGALWGGIAGALKAWRGVNEIISTIMLNFVAIHIVHNLVLGPLGDPHASHPTSFPLPQGARLPLILRDTRLHAGFLVAVVMCVLVYLFFRYTSLGFRLRAVGESPDAARHAGIDAEFCRLLAMVLAGGIAGLAGVGEVLGVQYRLGFEWSRGWGFPGIAVSFLSRSHPLGIIIVGLFFGILDSGSTHMQAVTGVPAAIVRLIQGMPVAFLIAVSSWQQVRARRRVERTVTET